jgi:hypothetical protein
MTAYFALDLASKIGCNVATCHALHRTFPAPDGNVLMVIGAVHALAATLLHASALSVSDVLRSHYGVSNPRLPHFCCTIAAVTVVLLPIFYRYVCRRMGYQAPGYLQTVAYLSLTNVVWAANRITCEFIAAAYYAHPVN